MAKHCTAAWPAGVSAPPTRTRSGLKRSSMAVPSARNSGLESTWKLVVVQLAAMTLAMASAVFTGTVDFSTMILGEPSPVVLHTCAMRRAASSCERVEAARVEAAVARAAVAWAEEEAARAGAAGARVEEERRRKGWWRRREARTRVGRAVWRRRGGARRRGARCVERGGRE